MLYTVKQRTNPLDRNEKKFYATASYVDDSPFDMVTRAISAQCSMTPADVQAVIKSLADVLPQFLMEGHSIKLGELGRLRISFSSKGQDKAEDVSAADITKTRVVFVPSPQLKEKLSKATFVRR